MKTFESREEELQNKLDAIKEMLVFWHKTNDPLVAMLICGIEGVLDE